jgi:hypothetical protein
MALVVLGFLPQPTMVSTFLEGSKYTLSVSRKAARAGIFTMPDEKVPILLGLLFNVVYP